MKETEFNIWYNSFISQLPKNNCIFNYDAKLGWNACRDKILEILYNYDFDNDFECCQLANQIKKL